MASQTVNTTNNSNHHRRQKRERRQENYNHSKTAESSPDATLSQPLEALSVDETPSITRASAQQSEAIICFICAEHVKFWAVSECNHRTCHVCALRLRALYKRMDCTFCKHDQQVLIFTLSPDKPFLDYLPEQNPFKDPKLTISFETQDMMEESMLLLRFNCPESSCDFIGGGWSDLKMHVRAVHGRQLCDLCVRSKKVFSHEQILYTHTQLSIHLPSYSRRNPGSRAKSSDQVEGGIHPYCEFCRESFFGDDELYSHMRERHEECFICKQSDIRHQYFEDYPRLEMHFNDSHFPCSNPNCLAQKFVVFGSKMDLQAHSIDMHGEDMSSRDRKGARRVVEGIQFEQPNTRVPTGRSQRPSDSGPSRPSRRDGFGSHLSSPLAFPSLPTTKQVDIPLRSETFLFDVTDDDPISIERNAAVVKRLNDLTSNSTSAVASVRAAARSYRASESGARDLISTVFTILNQDLDASASILNMAVDLLDDEEKRKALLAAWNGFKLEQRRQFPDLIPSGVGSSYSGISSGRVITVKQSAVPRASKRDVLDRVANAAARTIGPSAQETFPALSSSQAKSRPTSAHSSTPWSTSSSSMTTGTTSIQPYSVPGSASSNQNREPRQQPSKLSQSLFPSLPAPSSTTAIEARQLVIGSKTNRVENTTAAWGKPASGQSTPAESDIEQSMEDQTSQPAKRKKKGKEKQTLFTLGSFPS